MNTKDKSIKLAELMELTDRTHANSIYHYVMWNGKKTAFTPYYGTDTGRAQFAAILLKFPEVMQYSNLVWWDSYNDCQNPDYLPPTQANILDEILRMNGVDV